MDHDPVIEEIRAIREQIAARFGYDIEALARYAREKDAADNRNVVRLPSRRAEPEATKKSEAAKSTP